MIEKELKNSMNKWFFPGTAGSSGYGPDHPDLSRYGSSGHTPDHPALLGKNFKFMNPRI
jgi:hypothetical protein